MGLKPNDSLLNGKYLIEGVLEGFGFVYLARDSPWAGAIKEMNPTLPRPAHPTTSGSGLGR
ncbi:hypothetical protein [Candidatus Amarolinea dominans]|uniref:hypothetical protein n=1 Tax=Candidatus Amarolinea dominans TaxID=3140696 RepID=UPI001D281A96|nr:hypothetical protein [Anaerolineae bacterium]